MARSTRPSRRAPLRALTLAVVALGLAACSPIATLDVYSPSDGVRAVLGEEIRASNLLIITSGEGEPGVLLAGLRNLGDTETEVTVTVGSESFTLPIDARGSLLLKGGAPAGSGEGAGEPVIPGHSVEHVRISSVPAPPGAVTDVTLRTPSAGEVTVPVPVLDGTLDPYDDVVPGGGPGERSPEGGAAGDGTTDEGSAETDMTEEGSVETDATGEGSPEEGSVVEHGSTTEGAGEEA